MNYKGLLQEYLVKQKSPNPKYTTIERGLDHCKEFQSTVHIGNQSFQSNWCLSKKDAEKNCAEAALAHFNIVKKPSSSSSSSSPVSPNSHTKTPYSRPDGLHSGGGSGGSNLTSLLSSTMKKSNGANVNIRDSNGSVSHYQTTTLLNSSTTTYDYDHQHNDTSFSPSSSPTSSIGGFSSLGPTISSQETTMLTFINELSKLKIQDPNNEPSQQSEPLSPSQMNDIMGLLKVNPHSALPMLEKLLNDFSGYISNIKESVPKFNYQESINTPVKCIDDDPAFIPDMSYNTPRDYQIEMYNKSMKENIICCLPTGLGKTMISCMTIKRMKELNPKKRILFLTDRIPLVLQQSQVIKNETGLRTIAIHGDNFKSEMLSQEYDVMVVISALLNNLIFSKKVDLNTFSLIVIDEAHHIVKSHPFAVILKQYYKHMKQEMRPKILGLTASPAGKSDFLNTLISLKLISDISHCKLVHADERMLQPFLNNKNIEIIDIETNSIEELTLKYIKDTLSLFNIPTSSDNSLDYLCNNGDQSLSSSTNSTSSNIRSTEEAKSFILKVAERLINYRDFGIRESIKSTKQLICEELVNLQDGPIKAMLVKLWSMVPDTEESAQNISKLDKALDILKNFKARQGSDFRCILFVKTREMANLLNELLIDFSSKSLEYSFIKPALVIGHGVGGDGMSVNKQKINIEKFRTGECNIIVATSVVEEGFDVPSCNLVIRFDPPTTVTAMIQSRGRLREKDSHFIAIIKKNVENSGKYDLFKMQELYLRDTLLFLTNPNCPLPATAEIAPVVGNSIAAVQEIVQKLQSTFPSRAVEVDWAFTQIAGDAHNPTFQCKATVLAVRPKTNERITIQHIDTGSSKQDSKERAANKLLTSNHLLHLIRDF
ncbi:hypothetical protein CYY_009573 [Polysphondylium violaceum]|uniref:RNA helicase n=1 Tax=Polysphondylium violaceum TaxID=133409 RepID=A0A8J4PM74_9MYCE|nr:hypothetical protein CYY_009573 [Polysphondylium violaceum]